MSDPPSSPVAQRSPVQRSPPTSPPHSPVSSPLRISPPTSPGFARSSDSSPSSSPVKRKRRDPENVSRTTIRRLERKETGLYLENSNVTERQSHMHYDEDVALSDNSVEHSVTSAESANEEDSGSESSFPSERSSVASVQSSVYEVNLSENSDCDNSEDEGMGALYKDADITVNDALYRVLKVYVKEKWTKNSLHEIVKVIKYLLPQPNEFPSTGKGALKLLSDLTVSSYGEQEYKYCCKCHKLVENCTEQFRHATDVTSFFILPPSLQIKHMFEQRQLAEIIDKHREKQGRNDGCISDVVDGTIYQSVSQNLQLGPYDIVVVWNTDGVAMSGSSNQELWPILGTIVNIPPKLRQSFILVFGVYVGKVKPNMNVFLEPFTKCLQESYDKGFTWMCPVKKVQVTSKIIAPFLSADAPAKAMVINIMRFNSTYGCNICEQKTKRVPLTAGEIRANEAQTNPRKKIRRKRRFVFKEEPSRLRTAERMEKQGKWAEQNGTSQKGVEGEAVVSRIPFFDRAQSVIADYMHLLLLGVVKYFLSKIFFEHNGPWFIGNKIKEIDSFIEQIKVPDFVKRLPRGIASFNMWKASEFRNFLLYYSLPIFKEFLPHRYLQHWLLLVVSSYTLLKDSISENELQSCDIMLKVFVRDVGHLYGLQCYTFNVHNLLHLCLLVKRAGPLWATSAFPFEDFNGFIGALVHGTKHLSRELITNINISLSVTILGNIVNGMQDHHVSAELPELKNPCSCDLFDQRELSVLSDNNFDTDCKFFLRAKVMPSMFTSRLYDFNKTRCNSVVLYEEPTNKQNKYGEIITFIQSDTGSVYCLLKDFKVIHLNLFFEENSRLLVRNLVPIEITENYSVVPFRCIVTKVLKIGMYLGLRPNSVEVNL